MMIIDKRRGGGASVDMAQQVVQRAIDTNVPDHIKTGVRIAGIAIANVNVTFAHKLGRVPLGCSVLRAVKGGGSATSRSDVHEVSADANTITMQRSDNTGFFTYDFWVF